MGHLPASSSRRHPGSFYETRMVRKDGSVFSASISWRPVTDDRGKFFALCTFITDISEHKAAEAALGKADERYRVLAENSSDIFWEMELDGTFGFVARAVRLLGYEPEEWIGRHMLEFLPEDERRVFLERLSVDDTELGGHRYEVRALRKDGSEVWMEVLTDLVRQDGRPIHIQGAAQRYYSPASGRGGPQGKRAEIQEHSRELKRPDNARGPDGTVAYASPSIRTMSLSPRSTSSRRSGQCIRTTPKE